MQMTFEQAQRWGLMSAFSLRRGRGYMMRSEKRPGLSGSGGRKNPRRKKAGFGYILLTVLISLILWPIGMVMLWRRNVQMQAGTKLLVSLVTLCASIFLIVFTLTVPVQNAQFTAFQDSANDFLDHAAETLANAGDAAYQKGTEAWKSMNEFADATSSAALDRVADGIDWSVSRTYAIKAGLNGLFGIKPDITPTPESTAPTPTPEPKATAEAAAATATPAPKSPGQSAINLTLPSETPDPATATSLSAGLLRGDGSFVPGWTPDPEATVTPTPAPTKAVTDVVTAEQVLSALPAVVPEIVAPADAFTPVPTATLNPNPTDTPAPTPKPVLTTTPVPVVTVDVKNPGSATVYCYGSSVSYHIKPDCQNMRNAPATTLAEAIASGKHRCRTCGTPDASIMDELFVAWVDEDNLVHTSDECAKFRGTYHLVPLVSAVESGYENCTACQADEYVRQTGITPKPTPTPVPTATPEPEEVRPATPLKDAGEIIVYHSAKGKYYHKARTCKNMDDTDPHPLKSVVGKYKYCRTCNPPSTDLIGRPLLWVDEDGLCHTSDECAKFKGAFTLIERDEALAQGMTGCPDCGADEYLIPNTILAK